MTLQCVPGSILSSLSNLFQSKQLCDRNIFVDSLACEPLNTYCQGDSSDIHRKFKFSLACALHTFSWTQDECFSNDACYSNEAIQIFRKRIKCDDSMTPTLNNPTNSFNQPFFRAKSNKNMHSVLSLLLSQSELQSYSTRGPLLLRAGFVSFSFLQFYIGL